MASCQAAINLLFNLTFYFSLGLTIGIAAQTRKPQGSPLIIITGRNSEDECTFSAAIILSVAYKSFFQHGICIPDSSTVANLIWDLSISMKTSVLLSKPLSLADVT